MSQANEILLQMKYARIINGLAERLHIDNRKALRLFYESNLCLFAEKSGRLALYERCLLD